MGSPTPREEADRLVLLVDVVKWPELRDQIEAAIVAAEVRGIGRGRAQVEAEAVFTSYVANAAHEIVAVSPGLGCDGDVDL